MKPGAASQSNNCLPQLTQQNSAPGLVLVNMPPGTPKEGNSASRKGAPVNFDRCRTTEVTVLIIVPSTNGGGRTPLLTRGKSWGNCATSILAHDGGGYFSFGSSGLRTARTSHGKSKFYWFV
jgi:hypothetical protein